MPSKMKTTPDPKLLIQWLGRQGARQGMIQSKNCTGHALVGMARSLGLEPDKKASREQLVDEIIRTAGKRIDKSPESLLEMTEDQLINYFEEVEADPEELTELLKELDLDVPTLSSRGLVGIVARRISETGRFVRIATGRAAVSTGS